MLCDKCHKRINSIQWYSDIPEGKDQAYKFEIITYTAKEDPGETCGLTYTNFCKSCSNEFAKWLWRKHAPYTSDQRKKSKDIYGCERCHKQFEYSCRDLREAPEFQITEKFLFRKEKWLPLCPDCCKEMEQWIYKEEV